MIFRPLLLIFLAVNSDAQLLPPVKNILQNHLDIFQKAVDAGDKATMSKMIPLNHISDETLDKFIKAHKSMKMTAKSATFIGTGNTQSGISGVVEYARGGRTILLEVVVEKSPSSPSAYKFASIRTPPVPSQRRSFPTCMLGLVACYLHLIDVLPGSAEEILVR
ncbi:DUF4440 domain-containing protein [Caenorhabditis elegans]|uniref:DUF4440 domain-containing protein n=1 Tax=Caenorhabditis elegans TaxID=6239 RepID=Q86DM0_CAEEL|nr:DUF4440 domain-containing protein [Caenorhabditis elegans]CCD72974.1 DUF4440 domain-containing protein [Caenorhabditis elegans]|eukprot:NP_872032.1 Uncharacterized protein CELE_Y110A2AL.4 [Caenorhabditis elegans]